MQRLRPRMGQQGGWHQCQNIRFNSTNPSRSSLQSSTNSQSEFLHNPNSAQFPPDSLSTSSISAEAYKGPSSSRIAQSWGNIAIPSREDVSRNPHSRHIPPRIIDHSRDFRPHLGYLADRTSTLASRLAGRLTASQGAGTPLISTTQPTATSDPRRRDDPTIAIRRLERLEREKRATKSRQRPDSTVGKNPQRFAGTDELSQAVHQPLDGDYGRGSQPDHSRHQQPPRESIPRLRGRKEGLVAGGIVGERREKSMGKRVATNISRARGGLPSPVRRKATDVGGVYNEGLDGVFEEIGESPKPAQLTNPDFISNDLDYVFGPTFASTMETAIASPRLDSDSFLVTDFRGQWVLENLGGQYSRFASQTSDGRLASPQKLGPIKHAQLILGKRRDVNIHQRLRALDIVASLLGRTNHSEDTQT